MIPIPTPMNTTDVFYNVNYTYDCHVQQKYIGSNLFMNQVNRLNYIHIYEYIYKIGIRGNINKKQLSYCDFMVIKCIIIFILFMLFCR